MAPVLKNRTRLNISPEPPLSPEAGQSSSCSFSQLPNLDCTDPGALSRLKLRRLAPVVEVGDLPYSVLHIPVETSHGHMTVFHGLSVKSSQKLRTLACKARDLYGTPALGIFSILLKAFCLGPLLIPLFPYCNKSVKYFIYGIIQYIYCIIYSMSNIINKIKIWRYARQAYPIDYGNNR